MVQKSSKSINLNADDNGLVLFLINNSIHVCLKNSFISVKPWFSNTKMKLTTHKDDDIICRKGCFLKRGL